MVVPRYLWSKKKARTVRCGLFSCFLYASARTVTCGNGDGGGKVVLMRFMDVVYSVIFICLCVCLYWLKYLVT